MWAGRRGARRAGVCLRRIGVLLVARVLVVKGVQRWLGDGARMGPLLQPERHGRPSWTNRAKRLCFCFNRALERGWGNCRARPLATDRLGHPPQGRPKRGTKNRLLGR